MTRPTVTKLGNARKHRMSDLEKMFLSQQPFLQTYFNGMAKKLADDYEAAGTPARITITVIPTFAEKIYNIMTEIIPAEATSQDEVLRITRYIRFKDFLDSQVLTIKEEGKDEPNLDIIRSLLPDRLMNDFITVARTDENGETIDVQLRQESVVAMDWIEARCIALREMLKKECETERVRCDLGQKPKAPIFLRVLYDPLVSDHAVIVRKEGIGGEVKQVKDLGPILQIGITEQTAFEKLSVYEQSEVHRFLEGVVGKTLPWEMAVLVSG